jgi:N-methylhydantoinase A/oxoprolinase/acetone carboxylase beta subunit
MAVLEARGLVRRAGFTPTDALHVLGRLALWNADAARLGASLLAEEMRLDVEAFCKRVVTTVGRRITEELVSKILADEAHTSGWQNDRGDALLARVLHPDAASDLKTTLTLTRPIVAIGAPVAAYMPDVARCMHTELVIPAHADVANAVGAVAGGIIQRVHTLLNPCGDDGHVRLHLPESVSEFETVEQAIQYAEQTMIPYVERLAHDAGAEHVEVQMTRTDQKAPTARGGQEIYLGTELTFTATGRPRLAARASGPVAPALASPE